MFFPSPITSYFHGSLSSAFIKNVLGISTSISFAIRLQVQAFDHSILDAHARPFAFDGPQVLNHVEYKSSGLAELSVSVSHEADLPFCIERISPALHDVRIVHRNDNDLVEPFLFELVII